jgi:hypothetical protein
MRHILLIVQHVAVLECSAIPLVITRAMFFATTQWCRSVRTSLRLMLRRCELHFCDELGCGTAFYQTCAPNDSAVGFYDLMADDFCG